MFRHFFHRCIKIVFSSNFFCYAFDIFISHFPRRAQSHLDIHTREWIKSISRECDKRSMKWLAFMPVVNRGRTFRSTLQRLGNILIKRNWILRNSRLETLVGCLGEASPLVRNANGNVIFVSTFNYKCLESFFRPSEWVWSKLVSPFPSKLINLLFGFYANVRRKSQLFAVQC